MCPEFTVVKDRVFLAELFSRERFEELKVSHGGSGAAQFWMNLLEIIGVFEKLNLEQAILMANLLEQSWNRKLEHEFGNDCEKARVIYDQEADEVFVVIGQPAVE